MGRGGREVEDVRVGGQRRGPEWGEGEGKGGVVDEGSHGGRRQRRWGGRDYVIGVRLMGCEWQRRRQTQRQSRRTGSCPRQTSLVSSSLLVVPPPPPLDLAAVAVNRATHPLSFTPHSFVPSLLEPPRIPASSSLLLHPSSLLAFYSSRFPLCTYLTLCLALVSPHMHRPSPLINDLRRYSSPSS